MFKINQSFLISAAASATASSAATVSATTTTATAAYINTAFGSRMINRLIGFKDRSEQNAIRKKKQPFISLYSVPGNQFIAINRFPVMAAMVVLNSSLKEQGPSRMALQYVYGNSCRNKHLQHKKSGGELIHGALYHSCRPNG
jgi:hypothetical protein